MRSAVQKALEACPVEVSVAVIGGAWKASTLRYLGERTYRFGELQRALGPVTPRTLTRALRELEADGIIKRAVYAEVPPKVEYSLTPLGDSLTPLIAFLDQWGSYFSGLDVEPGIGDHPLP